MEADGTKKHHQLKCFWRRNRTRLVQKRKQPEYFSEIVSPKLLQKFNVVSLCPPRGTKKTLVPRLTLLIKRSLCSSPIFCFTWATLEHRTWLARVKEGVGGYCQDNDTHVHWFILFKEFTLQRDVSEVAVTPQSRTLPEQANRRAADVQRSGRIRPIIHRLSHLQLPHFSVTG